MPRTIPVYPVSGTVITRAWAVTLVDAINWLYGLAGSADPASANLALISNGTTSALWQQVPTAAIANGAITSAKMDSNLGDIQFGPGGQIAFEQENLLKVLLTRDGHYGVGVDTGSTYLHTEQYVKFHANAAGAGTYSMVYDTVNHTMTINGNTVWHAGNDGAGSGQDADTLDGVQGSGYALVADKVPSGMIAAFDTAAAIPAGWTRYTNGDGRLLVGAGTTFNVTYTENQSIGSNWTPFAGASVFTATAADVTGAASSGSAFSAPSHQHSLTLAAQTWTPVARVVVWAKKS